jgi:hypothetical protein
VARVDPTAYTAARDLLEDSHLYLRILLLLGDPQPRFAGDSNDTLPDLAGFGTLSGPSHPQALSFTGRAPVRWVFLECKCEARLAATASGACIVFPLRFHCGLNGG